MTATDLKSQLTLLKSLQDIDVSLHAIDKDLGLIPSKIDEAMSDYRNLKNAITQKEQEKMAFEKKRKDLDTSLEDKILHIKDREAKLYAIKTNKEYQAAIKEIADAKQSNKELEDELMRLMEKIDSLSEEITQLSSGIADKEKAYQEKEQELKKEESDLVKTREEKLQLRAEAEKGVDKEVLRQYRFIQQKFSDAMALAVNGVCNGCNKRIPPQVYIELMKWKELIICPNCHRLLFFEEAKAETEENN